MAGHYAMRKDFGLNTPRMALPEVQDSTSTSNQTMPGFTFEERARKRAGIISMQGEASEGGGKPKSSWSKKMRGFFRAGKKKTSDSGGNVVLESAHHSVPDEGNSSPTLHVRAVKSSMWAKKSSLVENGDREEDDQGALPYQQQLSEPSHWREEEKTGISRGSPELIRLTLKPKGAINEVETRQVTLWRKPGGFGVHLSAGLPPIVVTYVEPGGEAEAAGVCIGDVVLEVNGQDCREGVAGVSVVMGLKMLIQQVKVSSKKTSSGDADESSESPGEEPVDDAAWQRIKAKQDDMDSQASNVEVTFIDDASETGSREDLVNEVQNKVATPKPGPIETQISDKEWVRMKEQQELLFDKNAPSAIIQEKGKERRKKTKRNKQNEIVHSETMPAIGSSGEGEGLLQTPDQQPGKSASKTSPSWFGKKSGPKIKSPTMGDIAGEMTTPEAVLTSPGKGKERSGKRKKGSKSKKKSLSTESKRTVQKEAGDSMESYDGGLSPGRMGGASREETPPQEDKIHGGHTHVSNMGPDQVRKLLGPPSLARPHRSPSYHTMELSQEKPFRDELRQARSEYDITSTATVKVEIDPNMRVSKSGKVIGPSSRGSSRRPSIFDQSAASSEGEWDDGHVTTTPPSRSLEVSPAAPTALDLSAIPKMAPSLGLQHGHNRRDLAARSSSKRRPASMKKTLLLDREEGERMGMQRVSLSEERRHTLPTHVQKAKPVRVTVSKSRSLEQGDATMPPPTSSKERNKQEKKPQNLILQACLNNSPRVGQKSYDTSSGSSADKVSQALRKQQSNESETESPEFLRRRHTLGAVSGGFNILAEIRSQKEKEKEREKEREEEREEKEEGEERSVARKLFTSDTLKSESEKVELSEELPRALVSSSGGGRPSSGAGRPSSGTGRPSSGAGRPSSGAGQPSSGAGRPSSGAGRPSSGAGRPSSGAGRPSSGIGWPTSASNRTGRIKSVDKPIKTLEIASEPEASAGSSPPHSTPPRAERPHRAKSVEKPVKTLGIASEQPNRTSTESKPPAWVAIAQGKHRRVSAVYTDPEPQIISTQPHTNKIQEFPPTPSPSSSDQPPSPSISSVSSTPKSTKPSKVESSLPKRGTVKDRMALFQNPK